jgi:DNA-binding NarL/FixJ family response regulator
MSEKIKVLVADDHQLFVDGVKLILKKHPDVQVVAEAGDGASLLSLLKETAIDLVITDLSMPGMKGIELVKAIKQKHPQVKLLVVTMHNEQEIISEILQAEAEGYILKNSGKTEMLEAVDDLMNGKTHYDKEVLHLLVQKIKKEKQTVTKTKPLTERELQILSLIVKEFTSKEIAEQLGISKQTVDTHRMHIMEKTGAQTLVGLIKYALSSNII